MVRKAANSSEVGRTNRSAESHTARDRDNAVCGTDETGRFYPSHQVHGHVDARANHGSPHMQTRSNRVSQDLLQEQDSNRREWYAANVVCCFPMRLSSLIGQR
jgi:hypothetical protein